MNHQIEQQLQRGVVSEKHGAILEAKKRADHNARMLRINAYQFALKNLLAPWLMSLTRILTAIYAVHYKQANFSVLQFHHLRKSNFNTIWQCWQGKFACWDIDQTSWLIQDNLDLV